MTDKHTPGPWMQLTGPNGRTYITDRADSHWASHCIAEVKEDANARLIAAAPKLLEALEKAMDDAWYNDDSNIERIEPEWIVQARAVIKAANGTLLYPAKGGA